MRTAAVAVATIAVALLVASSSQAAHIEVTARLSHSNVARLPPIGRGGNAESSLWLVHDRYGNVIGDVAFECRWVTSTLRLCVGQVQMPLGMLAVMGASRTRFLGQLAVVGGTGRYSGAGGTMLFRAIGAGATVLSIDYDR